MTLLAVHAGHDSAHVMTDTRSADHIARRFSANSKVLPLPHLDAAIVTQGSLAFTYQAQIALLAYSAEVATFDEMLDRAPRILRGRWQAVQDDASQENATHGRSATPANSVVFLVGRSLRAGRFTATGYASDFGFRPDPVEGLHVQPFPFSRHPSALELHRLRRHFHLNRLDTATLDRLTAGVNAPPDTDAGWLALAEEVRQDRAYAPITSGLKWMVGGDVILTTLTAGESTSRRVHTFDDSGPQLLQMVAGTLHPLSQAAPCICGSGRRLIDCCVQLNNEPCPCQSGRTFGRCCSIDAFGTQPALAPFAIGR